jgi:hypothetical protein
LSDSGTLAIDATRFSYTTSPQTPLVAVDGFRGLLTLATSQLQPVASTNTCRFEITGDGSAASVLALNNLFWDYEPGVTAAKVWLNRASPPAQGGLVGCNLNGQRDILNGGFGFLDNIVQPAPHVQLSTLNPQPPAQPSTLNSQPPAGPSTLNPQLSTILERHLAPLREARVWLPAESRARTTNLRIYRVMVVGGADAVVEFRGMEKAETLKR